MANGTDESATGMNSRSNDLWYCHSCQKHVVANLTEYCCTLCESGCIEAVKRARTEEDEEDVPEAMAYEVVPPELPALPTVLDSAGLGFSGLVSGASGRGGRMRRVRRPARRTHIAIHRIHNNGAPGAAFQSFINQFMQSLLGNGGGALPEGGVNIQVQPLLLTGNTGDYVFSQGGLDNIITLEGHPVLKNPATYPLMNQLDGSGPPPAEKSQIEALPTVNIDQQLVEDHVQCHVCMEEYVLSEPVRRLPCKHLFHSECIIPWLELHGTCPICRQGLESPPPPDNSTADEGSNSYPLLDNNATLSPQSENPDSSV